MTITRVGVATGTTTCTVPAHAVGDVIVICAGRSNTTAPSLPAGYTSILTKAGTGCSLRLGFKIATSTSDASGTWTNAAQLTCHVYSSNQFLTGGCVFIGGSASSSATNNTIPYPALTMTHGTGTSWAAGFCFCTNTTNTITTAPSGMTNESAVSGTTQIVGHDTNGTVSSWSLTNATTTGTPGDTVTCTVEIQECAAGVTSINNIVQHVSSSYNPPVAVTETGNNYIFMLPNPVGSGNAVVIGVSYPSGSPVTSITDDKSNSWSTTAAVTADPGAGNQALKVYVLASSTGGMQTITIAFGGAVQPVKMWFTELYNVTATVNGTATATSQNVVNVASPGSFTPTNNNANGGNLILSYMCDTATVGTTNPFRILAASGYSLNDSDIAYVSNDGMPNASQFFLQATSAATVPLFNVANGGTSAGDSYNIAALALSIGTQGTPRPAGLYVNKIIYFSTKANVSPQAYAIPTTGNCGLMVSACSLVANPTITSASDSDSVTWTKQTTSTSLPTFLLGSNLTANPGKVLSIVFGQTAQILQMLFYDISGAAASPLGVVAGNSASVNGLSSAPHQPDITPGFANSLVIAYMQDGLGPCSAVTSPTGAIWDFPNYTGETDSGNMAWGDAMGHLYNSGTSALNWTWTITNQVSNSVTSTAIEIKAPASSLPFTPWPQLGPILAQ